MEKFGEMQDCMKKYPELYDKDDEEENQEAANLPAKEDVETDPQGHETEAQAAPVDGKDLDIDTEAKDDETNPKDGSSSSSSSFQEPAEDTTAVATEEKKEAQEESEAAK